MFACTNQIRTYAFLRRKKVYKDKTNTVILLAIIITEIDSACSVTVCNYVAYLKTALTGERVYPNNKDLTGTIQLDIDKQTKNMHN